MCGFHIGSLLVSEREKASSQMADRLRYDPRKQGIAKLLLVPERDVFLKIVFKTVKYIYIIILRLLLF